MPRPEESNEGAFRIASDLFSGGTNRSSQDLMVAALVC